MIHDVSILPSALKHGFAEEEIHYAWCEYLEDSRDFARSDQSVHVRLGAGRSGNLIEMIGDWKEEACQWQVFHAMKPRAGRIAFLGLEM